MINIKKLIIIVSLLTAAFAVNLSALQKADKPYSVELPIPPVLKDSNPSTPELELELTAAPGEKYFFKNTATETFGFNGNYLGPTIRVKRGQKVLMSVTNKIGEMTTVHWHGLHVPGEMDGGPHQMIEPGETWKPYFTINQPAATLWYHPHPEGKTGKHVYKGLAGMFIIYDEESGSLNIPDTYGIDDVPVIIQDRRFAADASFVYIQSRRDIMQGAIGNVMLINGQIKPVFNAQTKLVRFRILNGSNASIYEFSFGGKDFSLIATDGGFLEKPVSMDRMVLSPGERAEVILDLSRSREDDEMFLKVREYHGNSYNAMKMKAHFSAEKSSVKAAANTLPDVVPDKLTKIERINPEEAVKTRRFVMQTLMGGNFSINGKKMDMNRIDETVKLGTTEIWEIENPRSGMMNIPHSFHIHDIEFQILSRNGKQPSPSESGWKDTVLIWPGDRVRIIGRFNDYTGIYMYHCHILEHEDAGMMGQFEVVE